MRQSIDFSSRSMLSGILPRHFLLSDICLNRLINCIPIRLAVHVFVYAPPLCWFKDFCLAPDDLLKTASRGCHNFDTKVALQLLWCLGCGDMRTDQLSKSKLFFCALSLISNSLLGKSLLSSCGFTAAVKPQR